MTSMDFWIPNSDKLIITQPLLGRGFKLSEEGFRDYVWTDLKEENHFKSDHITTAGHYTLSKDASSLLEALNVSGSASLQFKIFTGEAAGQFTVDNTSSSNVVVVKFKSEKVSHIYEIDGRTLKDAHVAPHLLNMTGESIMETIGLHYLSGIIYGASLEVTFKFSNVDSRSVTHIMGSLEVGVNMVAIRGALKGAADFEEKNSSSSTTTSIVVESRGYEHDTVTDLDGVEKLINEFRLVPGKEAAIGFRALPIPSSLVTALRPLDSLSRQIYDANVGGAAKYLSEFFRLSYAIEQKKTEFDNIGATTNPDFTRVLKPLFMTLGDQLSAKVLDERSNAFQYLSQSADKIVAQHYVHKDIQSMAEFKEKVNRFLGTGVELITVSSNGPRGPITGNYVGHFVKQNGVEKPAFLGHFIASAPATGSYNGCWNNGQRWAKGDMTWPNSDHYSGDWLQDQMWGYGIMTFASKDVHEGYWANGLQHGPGTLTRSNGTTVVGTWTDGELTETFNGRIDFPNGDMYEGEVDHVPRPHGNGLKKFYLTQGGYKVEHLGAWREGNRHGQGTETNTQANSSRRQERGNWDNDVKRGSFTVAHASWTGYYFFVFKTEVVYY